MNQNRPENTRDLTRSTSDLAFELRGITKIYETGHTPVTALQAVNLDIRSGEFVSLVGPSGCGKTTLLRIVGGLTQPSNGQVIIGINASGRRKKMSFVFQDVNLLPWRSVLRNVEFGLEPLKEIPKKERRRRSMAALERVGLADVAHAPPYTLSGGMQQRVGLARALATEPDILLMDEPFGALDNFTREGLQRQLARLWEGTGTTVLFVTHDIDEAIFLSTEIIVMRARPGRVDQRLPVNLPHERWKYDVRIEEEAIALRRSIRQSLGPVGDVQPDSVDRPVLD